MTSYFCSPNCNKLISGTSLYSVQNLLKPYSANIVYNIIFYMQLVYATL